MFNYFLYFFYFYFISYWVVLCLYSSAGQRLITINHIQNKSFCVYNIYVCTVYIYYVYIKTHTYSIYLENIYMYSHVQYIFIFI